MIRALATRYSDAWLQFAVPRAQLLWFRLAFFVAVGIDGFLQIAHASRYGAGGFNVAHLAWLEIILPSPTRAGMVIAFSLQAYLGFMVAFGAGRVALWLLTLVYGYSYFISQLDSYQHHYLVFLVLVVGCFVPWHRLGRRSEPGSESGSESSAPVESWAVRLLTVQIALVYLWAAVAKLDPLWLDGTTLARQLGFAANAGAGRGDFVTELIASLGAGVAAKLVLIAELFLVAGWLVPRLRLPALIIGLGLHLSIEITGFEIGIFTYFMFALYTLLLPHRLVHYAHSALGKPWAPVGKLAGAVADQLSQSPVAIAAGAIAALGTGAALLSSLPFDPVATPTILVSVVAVALLAAALARRSRRRVAVALCAAHLASCAAIFAAHYTTDTAHEYYKYWAGSSRRLDNWDEAKTAYEVLTRISPDYASGHFYMGVMASRDGEMAQALEHFRRAQRANPDDYRAFLQEALIHYRRKNGPEAARAARRVVELAPDDRGDLQRARAILKHWRSQ